MNPSPRAALLMLSLPLLHGCEDLASILGSERYFVRLKAEPAEVVGLVNDIATEFDINPIHIYDSVSEGFSVNLPPGLAEELENLDLVEYVVIDEPEDYSPPDDVLDLAPDEVPLGIQRIGGPYAGGGLSGVGVAVIDTGIELDHPDLNVVHLEDIVCEGGGDCAPGGDANGHGTHVAGTIGAIDNQSGVVGVAPGVPLYAVRVLDKNGAGYFTDILAGIEFVMETPEIRVANLSLGGYGSGCDELCDAMQALEDSGVVMAVAAGNEGADTSNFVPAGYDIGIVVSAYDASSGDRGFAGFSNYGSEVDIAAPGVDIESTLPNQGWGALSGTSMAAPHVAGAAAVAFAIDPNLTPKEVRGAIVTSGEDNITGQGGDHQERLLDLAAMVDYLGG